VPKKSSTFRDFDFLLFSSALLLSFLGILIVYSSVGGGKTPSSVFALRQVIWVGLGIVVMFLGFFADPQWLVSKARAIYVISLVLLAILLLLGKLGLGFARWFHIGSLSFQPSEFAKIAYIAFAAQLLAKKVPQNYADLSLQLLIAFIPALLISAQPDLGTAFIFIPLLLVMLFWAGLKLRLFIALLAPLCFIALAFTHWWIPLIALALLIASLRLLGAHPRQIMVTSGVSAVFALASPLLWNYGLREYQRLRLLTLFHPSQDPLGSGYNVIQSQIAIGSGGFWGKGLMNGTQSKLLFLPEQHTDFIFPVLAEELGFWGVVLLLSFFAFIVLRGTHIARRATSPQSSLLAIGIVGLIAIQLFINIAMTVGLFPVTGITLPFISYGGSSILLIFFCVGLLLGIEYRRHIF
jgi:rod shape determining protein RodA